MTLDQGLAFGLLATTIGFFVWGRLPYDLVALSALLVGIVIKVVPEKHAFEGFADEIVVIIAAALVVSACIARSGVIEVIMRPVLPRLRTAANIDRTYVGRVERGSENVTISTLEMLAKVLSVPVAALLVEPAPDDPPPVHLRAGRRAKRDPTLS